MNYLATHKVGELPEEEEQPDPLKFPVARLTKTIPCGKCGKTMTVTERTVMAFCAECSAEMGKKK